MGDSGFLSSGDENHGEALELHKWCQALLSNFKREFGIVLKALQGKRASSRVEGEISWFFSSCLGTLEVPLNLRLGLIVEKRYFLTFITKIFHPSRSMSQGICYMIKNKSRKR